MLTSASVSIRFSLAAPTATTNELRLERHLDNAPFFESKPAYPPGPAPGSQSRTGFHSWLRDVGWRWPGARRRVRVIEADDCQAALPRLAACGDVIARVKHIGGGRIGTPHGAGHVASGNGLVDAAACADQHAAALSWLFRPGMRHYGLSGGWRQLEFTIHNLEL